MFYKVIVVPSRWRKLAIHVVALAAGAAVLAAGNAITSIVIPAFSIDPVYATAIGAVVGDAVRQLTLEIQTWDGWEAEEPGPPEA